MLNPISTRIVTDETRLSYLLQQQFDLSLQELSGVAMAIFRGFSQVTALHPKGFNGTNGWAEGTSHLRAVMIPKGWKPQDPQGQPRIASPGSKRSITVSSGNSYTGVPTHNPKTRNDKGAQTAGSVGFNARQGELFALDLDNAQAPLPSTPGEALWVFLYYIDLDAGEIRYELSQPTHMSESQHIDGWSTRYILPSLRLAPMLDESRDDNNDDSPDIEIDVSPKFT